MRAHILSPPHLTSCLIEESRSSAAVGERITQMGIGESQQRGPGEKDYRGGWDAETEKEQKGE